MDLYRVTPFKRIQQIADQAALYFVSFRKFDDDPHEAPLIRALLHQDGVEDVMRVLKDQGEDPLTLIRLIQDARNAESSAYMQCWTEADQHNLMWDSYGKGADAVRMRMTEHGQKRLPSYISIRRARYEDNFDILKELKLVCAPPGWPAFPHAPLQSGTRDISQNLTFKLAAYSNEREVRLLTPVVDRGLHEKGDPPWWVNPDDDRKATLVPIGRIGDVISGLMVGPKASDDLQRQVENFCRTHGLDYEGKSHLRTAKYTGPRKIFTTDPD